MESKNNQTGSQEIKPGRGGKRQGAGRPKRAGATPTQAQADQVEAARRAYDSKLAVRTQNLPPRAPPQTDHAGEPSVADETIPVGRDPWRTHAPDSVPRSCAWFSL